jgi:hypothetical protein
MTLNLKASLIITFSFQYWIAKFILFIEYIFFKFGVLQNKYRSEKCECELRKQLLGRHKSYVLVIFYKNYKGTSMQKYDILSSLWKRTKNYWFV